VRDAETLAAALLHDTIEDTQTTEDEIRSKFGERVLALVLECTDDKRLPNAERKRLQIEHAPHKSPGAKQIKLADKINNVIEMTTDPPAGWSIERRREYLEWTAEVVRGLRGQNPALEARYDQALQAGIQALQSAAPTTNGKAVSEVDPD
jgi:guanosine-3',5'-bis(diphosphate) 3'-pyrophosphohydrolase